jgi:hypothetical protein
MADLIDRAALYLKLEEGKNSLAGDTPFGKGMIGALLLALIDVQTAPAVDAVEVKHGEWEITEDDWNGVCADCVLRWLKQPAREK